MSVSKSRILLVILFIASVLPLIAVAHHVKGKIKANKIKGKTIIEKIEATLRE